MIQRVSEVQQFLAKEKAAYKRLKQETSQKKGAAAQKLDAEKGKHLAKSKVIGSAWYMFEMALAMSDKARSSAEEGDASQIEVASEKMGRISSEQEKIGDIAKKTSERKGLSGPQMSQALMKEQAASALNSSQAFLAEQTIQSKSWDINNLGSQQQAMAGLASHVNTLLLQEATFLRYQKN